MNPFCWQGEQQRFLLEGEQQRFLLEDMGIVCVEWGAGSPFSLARQPQGTVSLHQGGSAAWIQVLIYETGSPGSH